MIISREPLVAFNAHLLAGEASYRSAGISVYIVNLLSHLAETQAPLRFRVFVGSKGLPQELITGPRVSVSRTGFSTRHPLARVLWEQTSLPWRTQRAGAALLHAPAFVGPIVQTCPQVITVHDLSFLRYPEFFQPANRLYLGTMTRIACRRAAAVIAVSQFTASEVTALLGVPAERIHVVYHGVEPRFHPVASDVVARFRAAEGLPERFILHMGTLEPRKNLIRLVRAFARLDLADVHLVLAGGRGWFYESLFAEVERLGLTERVHFPGYVPAETQTLWYNTAEAVAYISTYEGFGLPVLEALACGVPTLTAATTSLPEAAGDAALTVPPDDEAAIAEGLRRLLTEPDLREQLRERGLRHAAQFSWQETSRRTVDVYTQVLRAHKDTV